MTRVLFDYQIISAIILVVAAWRFGNWKKWHQYYQTILYIVLVNFIYNLISYNYPLWEYESPLLKTTGSDLLLNLTAAPAVILLFLTYLDKIQRKPRQFILVYLFFWVSLLTLIEILSYRLGFFSYHNGWNIRWSALFNCIAFPMMWLHYKRPLWATALAPIFTVLIVAYFKIPFSSFK